MKFKKLPFFSALALGAFITSILFTSYSGGVTGKTTDGCGGSGCHDIGTSPSTLLLTGVPLGGYIPGNTYTITAVGGTLDTSKKKYGLNLGVDKGTLSNPSADISVSGGNEIKHTTPKSFSFGIANFSFSWTATSDDSVIVSYAFNAVNGNTLATGDAYSTGKQVFRKNVSSVSEYIKNNLKIYPNPSVNEFVVEGIENQKIISVEAMSVIGSSCSLLRIDQNANKFSTSHLLPGTYIIILTTDKATYSSTFSKQ